MLSDEISAGRLTGSQLLMRVFYKLKKSEEEEEKFKFFMQNCQLLLKNLKREE